MTAHRPRRATFFRVLESLGEDAWQANLHAGELCVGAAFWASLGYESGALPLSRKAAEALVHPLDLRLARDEVALHFKTPGALELEMRVRAANGAWHAIRVRGCVTEWDQAGEPCVMAGLLDDWTENLASARAQFKSRAIILSLSNRERQVLDGVIGGARNKTIAFDLGLSPRTVEGYRARMLEKLGVKGTSELVQMALSAGVSKITSQEL